MSSRLELFMPGSAQESSLPTTHVKRRKKDTNPSRTSNRLVIRPPATVSCIALFPKTNASLLALCTVTSTEQTPGDSQLERHDNSYKGLRTTEVLGANLAGQGESAACAAFQDDVAHLLITGLL